MARRPNTIKIDTAAVQGEGSYLVWRRLTWGERREIKGQVAELEGEAYREYLVQYMTGQLLEWNWVDVDGKPLPLPKTAAELDVLYPEESDFLVDLATRSVFGRVSISDEDLKN